MRTGMLIAIVIVLSALLLAAVGAITMTLAWESSRTYIYQATIVETDAPGQSNLGYLVAGTLLTWAGFFAYAIYIARKNRELRREVEELRRLLGERE